PNSNLSGETPMKNTKSLVELARLGDEEAFRLIFEQHHRIVLRFVYGMVGNLDLAEELTQETFLSAYRTLDSYKEEGKLTAWLCGIAKNVARNWTRSQKRETVSVDLDEQQVFDVKDNVNQPPDNILLNGELNDKVVAALHALDEDKQTVFILKVLRQFSYEEISRITGSTVPKLKTDLHRARIEMQRLIRPYLEGDYEM
ncbi:MAG TPA: RNA polymerase sigma factor, partial [Pyrinomonadaceae bacterium]|nr:RNA polymerase sigma factor [Pyrinomonadaceae bacterium]